MVRGGSILTEPLGAGQEEGQHVSETGHCLEVLPSCSSLRLSSGSSVFMVKDGSLNSKGLYREQLCLSRDPESWGEPPNQEPAGQVRVCGVRQKACGKERR